MDSWIPYLQVIVTGLGVVIASVFFGCGAVYFFNKMPAQWFCDYGKVPEGELAEEFSQRVKTHPWKVVFTVAFLGVGMYLAMDDLRFAIPAMCTIWLLLEMAIGDIKYRIVPDQLIILTAVSAIGYIPYYDSILACVTGMALGLGIMGLSAAIGYAIYRKQTIGGGDIKLFGAIGFVLGPYGILIVYAAATILAAVGALVQRARHPEKRGEAVPMVPYIALAVTGYLVFLWGLPEQWIML